MKPSRNELVVRDLMEPAEKIARKYKLSVEDMFGWRMPPGPAARLEFYRYLHNLGWSTAAIARFCGKHHTTVSKELK